MVRVTILLITVALVTGMAGCTPGPVQYSLTISITGGGEMVTPGEGTFPYNEAAVVPLVAFPHTGYRFVNWTGDVGTIADVNAASTTITMNADYSITASFEEQEAVFFADPDLLAAIGEAINIPERPIYPSDLKGLTSLDAHQENISDLTGLEHATGLTELHLQSNQISDISPLANLISLRELWLSSNQISDVGPLVQNEGLATGDEVHLEGNPLSSDSINIYIPQLEARGVIVDY